MRLTRWMARWIGRLGVAVVLTIAAAFSLALGSGSAMAASTDHQHRGHWQSAPAAVVQPVWLTAWSGDAESGLRCPGSTRTDHRSDHGRMAAFCCAVGGCLAVPVALPVAVLPSQRTNLADVGMPAGVSIPEGIGVLPEPPPPRRI